MPRIRTIKPEFWTDPVMVQLPPLARLFYIGTWNFAICDQGHLEDDPLRLKLQILPAESVDVGDLMDALVQAGRLERIEVDGGRYLHICNLAEHQKVDGRWTPRCPVCTHQAPPSLTQTPRASPKNAETHRSKGREGKGKEGKGKVGADAPESDAFATFYALYPKKASRPQASKAHKAALKKADEGTILAGLKAHLPIWERTERQFIPNPATWLNGERWADDLDEDATDDSWAHLKTPEQIQAERGF